MRPAQSGLSIFPTRRVFLPTAQNSSIILSFIPFSPCCLKECSKGNAVFRRPVHSAFAACSGSSKSSTRKTSPQSPQIHISGEISSIMPPPCSVIIPAPSMQSMFSLPHFGQHRLFDIFTFVSVSVFLRARESMLRTFAPFLRITKHFQSLPTPAVKRYLAARSSFGSTRILLFPSASSVSMPFLYMSASLSIA